MIPFCVGDYTSADHLNDQSPHSIFIAGILSVRLDCVQEYIYIYRFAVCGWQNSQIDAELVWHKQRQRSPFGCTS